MKKQEEIVEIINNSQTLHGSIINVMNDVKNIDKSLTVGDGKSSYKGVADKDVKLIIGQAMAKHNLTCIPIDIQPIVKVDRWSETQSYNGQNYEKSKQSIFTEVLVKYQITHALTNESIIIVGYGHGVDSQDKSAGKATTYALKNALLYTFLVPTGSIDDTDKTHSNDIETPSNKKILTDERFKNALNALKNNEVSKDDLLKFALTSEQLKKLNEL